MNINHKGTEALKIHMDSKNSCARCVQRAPGGKVMRGLSANSCNSWQMNINHKGTKALRIHNDSKNPYDPCVHRAPGGKVIHDLSALRVIRGLA